MKILLSTFFEKDISEGVELSVYNDHFGIWLADNLPKDKVEVKFLISEKLFNENQTTHLIDRLNPVLMSNNDIKTIFDQYNGAKELFNRMNNTGFTENESSNLKGWFNKNFGDWVPDLIITEGITSAKKMYKDIFPSALCMTQENAIFSRPPFKRTLSYDVYGTVLNNFLIKYSDKIRNFPIDEEEAAKIVHYKKFVTEMIDSHSPLDDEMAYCKKQYEKLVLLPLVGAYLKTVRDCDYDNEFNLLEYVMQNTPASVGVFVTRHDSTTTLSDKDMEYFIRKYPNFLFLQKTNQSGYASNSLHYFKYIDALINITSKTSLFALLWDKPVLSLANVNNDFIKDGQGMNDLEKVLSLGSIEKNGLLYWYLTHYILFEQDFYKEEFLYNYFSNKIEKLKNDGINFDFYEKVNSMEDVQRHTTGGLLLNYCNYALL